MRKVSVAASIVALLYLSSCTSRISFPANEEGAGICGQVLGADRLPATGAQVYAYRHSRGGLRGPADFAAEVGSDGSYCLDLAPGEYYLIARSHRQADSGPPRPGDSWAIYPGNPVSVIDKQTSRAEFRLQAGKERRPLKGAAVARGETGFTGLLVDPSGAPVAGAFVFAYRDQNLRRMPDATSTAVGADGVFTIYVMHPGRWCLAARTRSRGQPAPGELYGVLAGEKGECRQVEAGELKSVGTIVLHPHP